MLMYACGCAQLVELCPCLGDYQTFEECVFGRFGCWIIAEPAQKIPVLLGLHEFGEECEEVLFDVIE